MPKYLTDLQIRTRNEHWAEGLLWCSHCKQFKPKENFYRCRQAVSNYGYRYYCKTCEYSRKRDKEKVRQYHKERNGELKQKFVDLAGGCCQRCGYDEFFGGLDFHHVYREEKEANPGTIIYNNDLEAAWREVDKCCLLCRSCHGGYTSSEWRAEFIKRNGLGWTVGKELPLDDNRYERQPPEMEETPIPEDFLPEGIEQLVLF